MIDRPSGAWLTDEEGNLTPDLADQAMAARYAESRGTGDGETEGKDASPITNHESPITEENDYAEE